MQYLYIYKLLHNEKVKLYENLSSLLSIYLINSNRILVIWFKNEKYNI